MVIGAQGTFFGRVVDNTPKFITEVMHEAAKHDGTSVVEMLQNCVIFNDGTHSIITDRETKDDVQLILRHGEKMIFGKERNKGIALDIDGLKVVTFDPNGPIPDEILVHDGKSISRSSLDVSQNYPPQFPIALGVIRSVPAITYCRLLTDHYS